MGNDAHRGPMIVAHGPRLRIAAPRRRRTYHPDRILGVAASDPRPQVRGAHGGSAPAPRRAAVDPVAARTGPAHGGRRAWLGPAGAGPGERRTGLTAGGRPPRRA